MIKFEIFLSERQLDHKFTLIGINQKLDSLFERTDEIYMSHITPQQKKALDESYQMLDKIFAQENPSELEQKQVDKIFTKIDSIFNQAESKLTPDEQKCVIT